MSSGAIRAVGFALFLAGMVLTSISQFLFLLLVKEINSRREPAQKIKILDMLFMGRFKRRERTRIIMRVHRELFPDSWIRDGFDNGRFFGGLSTFTGFALFVISSFP